MLTASGNDSDALLSISFKLDRRRPVSEQVYSALRQSIVQFKLVPGTPISENSICRQFDVSRTPVRAALQRLSEEGLVDIYPQQGTFVSKIRIDDIKDSHFVRRNLEMALLREAGRDWTKEKSKAMRDVVDIQANDIKRNDVDAFLLSDERFHQLFAIYAGREGVWNVIMTAKMPMMRFYRFLGTPRRLPIVLEEHLAILDALDRGNVDAAENLLGAHLNQNFVVFESLPVKDRSVFAE